MRSRGLLSLLSCGAIAVTGFLVFACSSGSTGPVDGDAVMAHVKVMVGHGPRPSGSPALRHTQAYIRSEIKKLGLKPHTQRWRDKKSKLQMENIWTEIPGKDPAGPILLLGAHYDTKICTGHEDDKYNFRFVGAIDGAGPSCLLLELARHLKKRENLPNIWLLWIDGEESIPFEWDIEQALHGSRYFVETMNNDKKRFPQGLGKRIGAFVLLDLIGSKNQKIDRDFASNSRLSDIFLQAAKNIGEADRMYESKSEMVDDHIPFKDRGVKVIDLIDFHFRTPNGPKDPRYERWWHTPKDDLPAMDPASLTFVGNLVWAALPILEKEIFGKK